MEIVNTYPPIIDKIAEVFPLQGSEIFAFGSVIYNPGAFEIPQWLIDHEEVHQEQQGNDVESWWERYLIDTEFRFKMELEAHQREYRSYCEHNRDRNKRVRYLHIVARKLSAPLYGSMVSVSEAVRRLK